MRLHAFLISAPEGGYVSFKPETGTTTQGETVQEARETLERLLTLLQSAPLERDCFVSHLYQARREYRRTCEAAGKSGKQIERCVISSFRVAESLSFHGDFRQWEDLQRMGD